MNGVPGVIQLLSKRASDGRTSPFSLALASKTSASLAERKLKHDYIFLLIMYNYHCAIKHFYRLPRCWFILARGATPSTAKKNSL